VASRGRLAYTRNLGAEERMKKTLKWAGIILVIVLLGIQVVRPEKTNPASDPKLDIRVHTQVPEDVSAILDRSCRDCHSNQTTWPWYSHVAPVSWLVVDDVNHGRSHVNFSEWGGYDLKKADKMLDEMCEELEKEGMPLVSYTWAHAGTRLSETEVKAVCAWTKAERQRLASNQQPSAGQP
jgi:hypothetical protein